MRKIYLISTFFEGRTLYKIGYTKRKVEDRIKEFRTGNCSEFDIVKVFEPKDYCVTIENALHKHFHSKKINGEWFDLSEEDVRSFENICKDKYEMFKMLNDQNTYIQHSNIKMK